MQYTNTPAIYILWLREKDKMNFKSKLIASQNNGVNKTKLDCAPQKNKDDFNDKYIGFFKTAQDRVLKKEIKSEKKKHAGSTPFFSETHQQTNGLKTPDVELFKNRRNHREKNQQLLSSFDIKENIKEIKAKLEKQQTQDERQTPLTPKK